MSFIGSLHRNRRQMRNATGLSCGSLRSVVQSSERIAQCAPDIFTGAGLCRLGRVLNDIRQSDHCTKDIPLCVIVPPPSRLGVSAPGECRRFDSQEKNMTDPMTLNPLLRSLSTVPGVRACCRHVRREIWRCRYFSEFWRFSYLSRRTGWRFPLRWRDRAPQLGDRTATTAFDRHYVYHPAWAARVLGHIAPREHIDIGSTLHFSTLVSAFVPMRFYDYRPADLRLSSLQSNHADLTDLPFETGSVQCLSCMHVIEHIGLGRYGDPLDPDGVAKAIAELRRVLAPGGHLLCVVPVGKPRIQFNAHRIYSYEQVRAHFSELSLRQCALVPDDPANGGLLIDPPEALFDSQKYGCGCFWFQRERST